MANVGDVVTVEDVATVAHVAAAVLSPEVAVGTSVEGMTEVARLWIA